VDVWQREVTCLEDPMLMEPAVGIDTTARLQTVWQVKFLQEGIGSDINHGNYSHSTAWKRLLRPSAGRLSTKVDYRGQENCLYRVEIHSKGTRGAASFKWARDNGAGFTAVAEIEGPRLTVQPAHRARQFGKDDWLEITDDKREFAGEAGELRKIKKVDPEAGTIDLEEDLANAGFVTGAPTGEHSDRHVRIRRWDGRGVVPLDDKMVKLGDDGVEVAFTLDPSAAHNDFYVGEYWLFAARTAAPRSEELKEASPRGIHHHYGCLAVVDNDGHPQDCRVKYSPHQTEATSDASEFQICVTAQAHNDKQLPIQGAIDKLHGKGGLVYLGPGIYMLGEPLWFRGTKSVRLRGQGSKTILKVLAPFPTGIVIKDSFGITLEDLAIVPHHDQAKESGVGIFLHDSTGVTIQRCHFSTAAEAHKDGDPPSLLKAYPLKASVVLAGTLTHVVIRDNWIESEQGVVDYPHGLSSMNREKLGTNMVAPSISGICLRDNVLRLKYKSSLQRIWAWLISWPASLWRWWTWRWYCCGFAKH